MSTDKTLADVQPGGRVRLGNQAERARFEEFLSRNPLTALCAGTAWEVWKAALSAQPSLDGQGDARALIQRYDAAGAKFRESLYDDHYSDAQRVELRRELTAAQDKLLTALAARQPVYAQGCDELRARTEGERAAYREGLEEGKKIAARQLVASNQPSGNSGELDVDGARQPVGQIPAEVLSAISGLAHIAKANVPSLADKHVAVIDAWLYAVPTAQAVDPSDPWRGLYSPDLMPKLDGTNQYHVAHPDLPEWPKAEDEERGIGPLITAQGFAMAVVFGEYPDEEAEEVDYCAWLASWTPDTPDGIGWRLVCIQDSEDGPAAFFVRPLALIDSQAVGK